MARRILVPLDQSPVAEIIVPLVGATARGGGGTVRLLHACGADLIAVTTEGRSALGRAVLGSVAEQVVRKADAPVMLMRPGRHDF